MFFFSSDTSHEKKECQKFCVLFFRACLSICLSLSSSQTLGDQKFGARIERVSIVCIFCQRSRPSKTFVEALFQLYSHIHICKNYSACFRVQ